MANVEQIKETILALPEAEFSQDSQLEEDIKAGRLKFLKEEVLEASKQRYQGSLGTEIVFQVRESPEGGYEARALGPMKYGAIVVKTGNGYSAHLPDLPGCIAAADTFEETAALIREAVIFHLEGMVEDGDTIPEPRYAAVDVDVPTLDVLQQVAAESGG